MEGGRGRGGMNYERGGEGEGEGGGRAPTPRMARKVPLCGSHAVVVHCKTHTLWESHL